MTDAADPELPRGLALAWGIAADPQRGPKREMSVERIVEAAVELADADGLAAVSMSAVAARLGFTPMSLYRYVSAKDDLLLLMQEEATGIPSGAIAEAGDWRAQLRAFSAELVTGYMRHPWMLDLPITGSPATPNGAAWMDAGLAALSDTDLSQPERLAIVLLVTGQASWAGRVFAGYAKAGAATGETISDESVSQREDALFRSLITADAYPHLRAAIEGGVFLDEADPFAFGLERTLDGVATYIEAAAQGRHEERPSWPDVPDPAVDDDKKVKEARRALRQAERALRDARKLERTAVRDARQRRVHNDGT